MIVQNISKLQYFLQRGDSTDHSIRYNVNYHPLAPKKVFDSPETFMLELKNVKANSCPMLITEDNEMLTEHIWPLIHKYKNKPDQNHGCWVKGEWGSTMNINIKEVSKSFAEPYKHVWLPVDKESAENPWHVWIDMISKFRLLEKRYSLEFENYIYILSRQSNYFDKVAQELFPDLKYYVMPPNTTWHFDHLIVPSISNTDDGVTVPELPNWLRHKFTVRGQKQNKKIWISRENSITRKVLNEQEIILALKGWQIVKLESMSFLEQMKLFSSAEVVVAPHGAGLINLLWCYPKTKVIEFQDKNMLSKKVYPLLSHNLGLEHLTFTAETVPVQMTKNGKKPKGTKRISDLINFKINTEELLNFFNKHNI